MWPPKQILENKTKKLLVVKKKLQREEQQHSFTYYSPSWPHVQHSMRRHPN